MLQACLLRTSSFSSHRLLAFAFAQSPAKTTDVLTNGTSPDSHFLGFLHSTELCYSLAWDPLGTFLVEQSVLFGPSFVFPLTLLIPTYFYLVSL